MAFRVPPLGPGRYPGLLRSMPSLVWRLEQAAREYDLLRPNRYFSKLRANRRGYSAAALKLWSTVFVSFAATVTFWVCSPSFS